MGRSLVASLFAVSLLSGLLLLGGTAAAQTVAGLALQVDGDVDASLEADLLEVLDDVFAASARYDWIAPAQARTGIEESLRDCFSDDCLSSIGAQLSALIGLRVRFTAESEIYEWTAEFYHLDQGETLALERGICELCGRSELLDNFQASIRGPLATIDIGERRMPAIESGVGGQADGFSLVRVSVVPGDTRIFLDDAPLGIGDADFELEPGTYELRFSHDERRGLRETLIISENSPEVIFIRLHLARADGEQRMVMSRGDGYIDQIENNRRIYGWSALGIGAAMTVSSFFVARVHGQPACPDTPLSRCPEIYNTAGLATGLAVLGTAGLVSGAVLLSWPRLAGEERSDVPTASLQLTPVVGFDFGGFSLRASF